MNNNGTIILSGGGDIETSKSLDGKYFEFLNTGARILYIPIAMDGGWQRYEQCDKWFTDLIATHSQDKEIDYVMASEEDIPDFGSFDSVYIGGGNTFKLLDYIKKKFLEERFAHFLLRGGILYGGSAGAIICGSDIDTVKLENDKNYVNHLGLDLFEGMSFICHYTGAEDESIMSFIKNSKKPVTAIPEGSGMIKCSDQISYIGPVTIFNLRGTKTEK